MRQGLAFAAILLALLVRLQGLVLVAVLPTAILLKVLFELRAAPRQRPWRFVGRSCGATGSPARCWWSVPWSTSAGSGERTLALERARVVRGRRARRLPLGEVRHWVLLHFAELPLSAGVLPVCAFLVLLGLAFRRGGPERGRACLLAVTTASIAWIVVEVAAFASRFSLRIEERYMFFLAPLLFLAFVLWLDRGLPRPPVLATVAAAVPAALFFTLPLGSLLNVSIYSDTFGLIPFLRLSEKFPGGIPEVRHYLLVGGIAAGLAFVLWPREAHASFVLPASVAGFLILSSYPVVNGLRDYSRSIRDSAGTLGNRSWIDQRIGSGADAAYLIGTTPEPALESQVLWQNEFWNRSLRRVFDLNNSGLSGFAETTVGSPGRGLIVDSAGAKVRAPYVVSNLGFQVDGQLIAAHPPLGLFRTRGPLRLATAIGGIYGDGWMGAYASYSHFSPHSPPGLVTISLSRALWTGPDVPGHVRIVRITDRGRQVVRRWTIHSGASRTFSVPVSRGPFAIAVTISPTFSPSTYGQPDTRQLGAQVSFRFRPAGV